MGNNNHWKTERDQELSEVRWEYLGVQATGEKAIKVLDDPSFTCIVLGEPGFECVLLGDLDFDCILGDPSFECVVKRTETRYIHYFLLL